MPQAPSDTNRPDVTKHGEELYRMPFESRDKLH